MFTNLENTPVKSFSVTEISLLLKQVLEESFSNIRVKGEISGFKNSTAGHLYFSLKDTDSILNCICWRNTAALLKMAIEDGFEVICQGKISSYPGRSNYQLIINKIEVAGNGALLAMFEKRKAALAAEGLFDIARKKPLPNFPKRIGIITSANGVVIQDILHRINDRFPVHVLVWNSAMQGIEAPAQVVAAIKGFNILLDQSEKPDIIIIARGGGSLEDLWCFNEEIVIRAIAASEIPIISAIGHESDFTLADFTADLRAPTPTAAAEMAVPVLKDVLYKIHSLCKVIEQLTNNHIKNRFFKAKIAHSILNKIEYIINNKVAFTKQLWQKMHYTFEKTTSNIVHHLNFTSQLLKKYDQMEILKRGFAIIQNDDNQIITSINAAQQEESLCIKMHDGILHVKQKDT